ncbi:hypothetical protein [Shewanella waksmanii]|uniref:hypothetical protein n=1 Tax=Shewanella waksmanii TaxID=213783 RepID=UPI003734D896
MRDEQTQQHADYYDAIYARLNSFKTYIVANPGLIVSLFYLLSTVIGLAYTYNLLANFGLNVLLHLDLSDFILSAVHHPQAFIVTFVVVSGLAVFTFYIDPWLMGRFPKYRHSNNDTLRKIKIDPALLLLIVTLMLIFSMVELVAKADYRKISQGQYEPYQVTLIYPITEVQRQSINSFNKLDTKDIAPTVKDIAPSLKPTKLILERVGIISSTSRYLWLYQGEGLPVQMVSHDNVASILPLEDAVMMSRSGPNTAIEGQSTSPTVKPQSELTVTSKMTPAEKPEQN